MSLYYTSYLIFSKEMTWRLSENGSAHINEIDYLMIFFWGRGRRLGVTYKCIFPFFLGKTVILFKKDPHVRTSGIIYLWRSRYGSDIWAFRRLGRSQRGQEHKTQTNKDYYERKIEQT
jgi:hypothetical protein